MKWHGLAVLAGAVVGLFTAGAASAAAPQSDNAFYLERFTNYPDDPKSTAVGAGIASVSGRLHIQSTPEQDGFMRANNLTLPPTWVAEYDWTLNADSGQNFYVLYQSLYSPATVTGIGMRVLTNPSNTTTWQFQIQHGGGNEPSPFLNYGQEYHFTVVNQATGFTDVYIDGTLLNTYPNRNGLSPQYLQWGDPTGEAFGNAYMDNISIGNPVPEPAALGVLGMGAVALFRRRRTR